jgi:hypothetical protein
MSVRRLVCAEAVAPLALREYTLNLVVVEKDTGNPIAGAWVFGLRLPLPVPVLPHRTNEQGVATIHTRLRRFLLRVRKRGYKPSGATISLPEEPKTQTFTVELEKA